MRLKLDARARRHAAAVARRQRLFGGRAAAARGARGAVRAAGLDDRDAGRRRWATGARPAPVVAGARSRLAARLRSLLPAGAARAGPAAVTSLQLTLFGTRIDEATGAARRSSPGRTASSRASRWARRSSPASMLKAVAFDHVTIERGGAAEDLFLDQSRRARHAGRRRRRRAGAPRRRRRRRRRAACRSAQLRQRDRLHPADRRRAGQRAGRPVAGHRRGVPRGGAARRRRRHLDRRPAGQRRRRPRPARRANSPAAATSRITVERGSQTLPLAITVAAPQ